MFELSTVKKYLYPKRKQLSVSLIALMSVIVISLVVWLVLVFLSVTQGIENNWVKKLTSLSSPIRITPTDEYYSSHYYLVDTVSESSNYTAKSIGEKRVASTDPYDPEFDAELPSYWPKPDRDENGELKDPVKLTFGVLENLDLRAQDFESSGALVRLQLNRPEQHSYQYLTQVTYLSTFPDQSPHIDEVLLKPTKEDILHQLMISQYEKGVGDEPNLIKKGGVSKSLLNKIDVEEVEMKRGPFPFELLPENVPFHCKAVKVGDQIYQIRLFDYPKSSLNPKTPVEVNEEVGEVLRVGHALIFNQQPLPHSIPIYVADTMRLKAEIDPLSITEAKSLEDIVFRVRTSLQKKPLEGVLGWNDVNIAKVHADFATERENGVYLPKNFQAQGVLIGDYGYFSYSAPSASGAVEQRIPITVAGFYDPGVIPIGNKCILVPNGIAQTINSAGTAYSIDRSLANGIHVWTDSLGDVDKVKQTIENSFAENGISKYWKVQTYKEYDFVKELLQQFQSDKYLFSMIGVIILIVACSNIISLLVLLVNDKKKEIAIMQAMGASRLSIATIFGTAGILMGVISSLIGTGAAILTLKNIDSIAHALSFLQGHEAFNALFYGKSLPKELSTNSFVFVAIATPILSLLAGLIPAIKACKLSPAQILRSE